MQNNDLIGKVVLSLAGRDKNHLYVITSVIDDNYVLLSNGDTKKIKEPKKKKVKHLEFLEYIDEEIRSAIIDSKRKDTDLKIKRFLKLRGIVKEGWLPYVKRWCYRNARSRCWILTKR